MFYIHNMDFNIYYFDKIYSKNLIKLWYIMKLSLGVYGEKLCYKIKGPDLNPYEIRPITKSNDIFDTKFIDFDMIIFFYLELGD